MLLNFFMSLINVGYIMNLNKFYYIFLTIIFIQMFFLQLKKLEIDDPQSCFKIFKSNNYLGVLVLLSLLIGKI